MMKHCRKMKRRPGAHIRSMGRKRDMTCQCGDIGMRRDSTVKGKGRRRR
jgi:hypothetical protein